MSVPPQELGTEREERIGEITAQIGDLFFKEQFSDQNVTVTNERETADHEIVSGHSAYRDQNSEYVVQALGRLPTQLTIEGWITAGQLETADQMVSRDAVNVLTARWSGTAVPESVDVEYSRTYHDEHGWIFNTTFELIGANKGTLMEDGETFDIDERGDNFVGEIELSGAESDLGSDGELDDLRRDAASEDF